VACGGGGGDGGPPKFGGPGMKLLGRESSIVPDPTICFPAGVVCGSDAPVHPFSERSVTVCSPIQSKAWRRTDRCWCVHCVRHCGLNRVNVMLIAFDDRRVCDCFGFVVAQRFDMNISIESSKLSFKLMMQGFTVRHVVVTH